MAVFDINWDRWIAASINQHFETNRGTLNMFVEGQERRLTNTQTSYIELRQDGTGWQEMSRDNWKGRVEVNVLVASVINTDLYLPNRMVGQVTAILQRCIPVFRYGTGVQDDGTQVGELILMTEDRDRGHRIHKYGQIEQAIALMQSSVEASYKIWL